MADARAVLGVGAGASPIEHLSLFEGREMDFSSHDLAQVVQLLLRGNGNMLERLLGPLNRGPAPAIATPPRPAEPEPSGVSTIGASSRACVASTSVRPRTVCGRLSGALCLPRCPAGSMRCSRAKSRRGWTCWRSATYAWGGRPHPGQAARRASDARGGQATPHLAVLEGLERQLEEARESVLPEAPNHKALERFVVEVRLHRLCGGE